jgi:hypothetical protein
MGDEWLESPTKVKKDKKNRRRQLKQATTEPRTVSPETASSIVTPERSSDKTTGFWSLLNINQEEPETPTSTNDAPPVPPKAPSEPPNEPPKPASVLNDNYWDPDNMPDAKTTPAESLLEYLLKKNPKDMVPNTAPTRLDLIRFKLNLVEALSMCEGAIGLEGGHAYLVLTEPEYQRWISDPQASLPTKPTVPRHPNTEEEMTSAKAYFIKRAETALTLHKAYEKQTKHILEEKFPNSTIGLRDHTGKVPYSTTALTILQNISTKVKDDIEDNQLYMEVVTGIMEKTYEPSKDGAALYFQDIEDDQFLLQELGQTKLPYSLLIPKAQEAFHSQHDLKDMIKIARKWKQLATDNNYHSEANEYWGAFKEHYTQELKLLYMQLTDKQKKGKARYSADAVWQHNMQDEIDATREEIDTMSVALRSVLNEHASYNKATTPTTVTIPTAALSTVGSALTPGTRQGQGLEQLTAAIVAALQTSNKNQCQLSTTQPTQKKANNNGDQPWRQWNQYCWSCGVQLNHNSSNCKHPRTGHEDHLSATFNDQQGGNNKRNHLWEKWCGPDIGIYEDKGDTNKWVNPNKN